MRLAATALWLEVQSIILRLPSIFLSKNCICALGVGRNMAGLCVWISPSQNLPVDVSCSSFLASDLALLLIFFFEPSRNKILACSTVAMCFLFCFGVIVFLCLNNSPSWAILSFVFHVHSFRFPIHNLIKH